MRASAVVAAVVLVIIVSVALFARSGAGQAEPQRTVRVRRGDVEKTAVATGRIEPAHEVTVRSQLAGLVGERFVKLGDRVQVGDSLVEVVQEITRLDLVEARRNVEAARRAEEAALEYLDGKHLASALLRLTYGRRQVERMALTAELGRRRAEEGLEFLTTGRLRIGEYEIDTIVRAPVAGQVIDLVSSPGQRVVPVGSYQAPTEMATIADMDHLEFRGTVNEIDVDKLTVGMPAEIRIGALPGVALSGTVQEVGLKAKEINDAVVFDVKLAITGGEGRAIRAGYSATADVFIERRDNVLVLPERVIEFRGDDMLVRTPGRNGAVVEKKITLGLSDGLTVEVVDGLQEGELVLEKEYPEIE